MRINLPLVGVGNCWQGGFNKVVVNFLPVGHTHEDIDSVFSGLSHKMNSLRDVLTPKEFKKALTEATQPPEGYFHKVTYVKKGILDIHSRISDAVLGLQGLTKVLTYIYQLINKILFYSYIFLLEQLLVYYTSFP